MTITGLVNQKLLIQNEYLVAENRILRSHLPKCLLLNDPQRSTLAGIGKRMGRRALSEVSMVAKPETILSWYRRLVAQIEAAQEHWPSATCPRSRGPRCPDGERELRLGLFRFRPDGRKHSPASRHCSGTEAEPDDSAGEPTSARGRNDETSRHGVDGADGAQCSRSGIRVPANPTLCSARPRYQVLREFSIHSGGRGSEVPHPTGAQPEPERVRGALGAIRETGMSSQVSSVRRSSLRRALNEYLAHFHGERNHQGKGNVLLFPDTHSTDGDAPTIRRTARLGGLLNYYRRAA